MNKNNITPEFRGYCELRTNYSLEKLSEIISQNLFGGLEFGGREKCIHEEIPTVFIQKPILGMLIIIEGYSGLNGWFNLSFEPYGDFNRYLDTKKINRTKINLDTYIYHLLKEGLQNYPEIIIIDPSQEKNL